MLQRSREAYGGWSVAVAYWAAPLRPNKRCRDEPYPEYSTGPYELWRWALSRFGVCCGPDAAARGPGTCRVALSACAPCCATAPPSR
ncbi:hypothetical protein NDU88_001965 [Pleurodeles waltl]|uniref:Uncharacterized protein n=1 Tax=Pleurodeles waltl TaxID=8319 RepID=A0AAV7P5S5_PLEWA|nr:hypothetical protein NDU88_001965 [Pleurodeles waltl]